MLAGLLIINAAATWFMTGLIWFVQVVHYPLFDSVPPDRFIEFAERHCRLTTIVVAAPMITEAITSVVLLVTWNKPERALLWIGFALVLAIWLSTLFFSVPSHSKLCQSGYVESTHHYLVSTNWLRTWFWTARAILMAYLLSALHLTTSRS